MKTKTPNIIQKNEEEKEVITKENFLEVLKKVTRPLHLNASRGKGKKKTSE